MSHQPRNLYTTLFRSELFLGRQLAAFGHDERPYLDGHILEQLDRDLEAPDPFERLAADLAPVDSDLVFLPQLVRDVGRRDRAEQRAGGPGLDVEAKLDLTEPLRDRLCILERLRLALGAPLFDLAHL